MLRSFLLLSLLCLSFSTQALDAKIQFDAHGVTWTRHLIKEKVEDQTLLIAVDVPASKKYLQQVVFRKLFMASESDLLARAEASLKKLDVFPNRAVLLTPTAQPIYPTERTWTAQDEAAYGKWLTEIASTDYLVGSQMSVDCADYAMTLRWIYAHDHHLAMANSLVASDALMGSWSSTEEWDKLPTDADWRKDEKFKAALRYLLLNSFTHTLYNDLYPIAITPEFANPGAIYLTLYQKSGHTRTIYNIGTGGNCDRGTSCISIIWGNEPASEYGYITTLVPNNIPPEEGGFMRFRWPQQAADGSWSLIPAASMPGYSMEQYGWGDDDYLGMVSNRLGLYASVTDRYISLGTGLIASLKSRVTNTARGYFLCSLVACDKTDPLYDEWSTPQRDHQIDTALKGFQAVAKQVSSWDWDVQQFQEHHNVVMFDGAPFTQMELLNGHQNRAFSSDPSVDFFARWGIVNPTLSQKLHALSHVGYNNWLWREEFINSAQALCYPAGATTKACDSTSKAVHDLSTARLDQAFRAFQAAFVSLYNSAPTSLKAEMAALLRGQTTSAEYCDGTCTMFDFLIAHPEHLTSMSSDADASLQSRYGF